MGRKKERSGSCDNLLVVFSYCLCVCVYVCFTAKQREGERAREGGQQASANHLFTMIVLNNAFGNDLQKKQRISRPAQEKRAESSKLLTHFL